MATILTLCYVAALIPFGFCQEYEGYRGQLFDGENPLVVWSEIDISGSSRLMYSQISEMTWQSTQSLWYKIMALTSQYQLTNIDVDYRKRIVVGFDRKGKRIVAVTYDSRDGQFYTSLFEGTSSKVNGVVVDWTNDVVYWTDAAYDAINAVSMDMPNHAVTIVDKGLDVPFGIAVHPAEMYLFWTDTRKIVRSTLSGRNIRNPLIEFHDRRPTTLTIDYTHDRLYWLYVKENGTGHGIGSCDFNGDDVIMNDAPDPTRGLYSDLDVFKGQLFVIRKIQTGEHEVHIYKPNNGVLDPAALRRTPLIGEPFGIVIFDPERQRELNSNSCKRSLCPGVCIRQTIGRTDCFCTSLEKKYADAAKIRNYCSNESFEGLLVSKADGIYGVKKNFAEYQIINTVIPKNVVRNYHGVRSMTSDFRGQRIYYYEYLSKMIKSVKTSNGSSDTIVSLAVGAVGGLAVDTLNSNLYWTDSKLKHIMVSRSDGRYPVVLFKKKKSKLTAIAVHPLKRLLFWSDIQDNTIWRAFLDGSSPRNICHSNNRECRAEDLAIDFKNDRLYWCSSTPDSGMLRMSDLEGSPGSRLLILHKPKAWFSGLTIMNDYIVLTDRSLRTSGLHAYDKEDMKYVGHVEYPWYRHGNFFGVHYHHHSAQPRSIGLCRIRNPGCDQLCLPGSNRTVTCACSLGFRLYNRTRCVVDSPVKPYILVSDLRYRSLLQITQNLSTVAVRVQGLQQPYSIAYDSLKHQVYWTDLEACTISRATLIGDNQDILLHDTDSYFLSLAIDSGSRLLYFTVRARNATAINPFGALRVLNIDTLRVVELLPLENPRGLALNLEHRYIFYTSNGIVWRVDMNSSDVRVMLNGVNSDAVATRGGYVYVTHTSNWTNKIYRLGVNGENETVIQDFGPLTKTSSLAADLHYLFWTNTTHRTIERVPLDRPDRTGQDMFGGQSPLITPSDLFVSPVISAHKSDCSENNGGCEDLCLPSPRGPSCHKATPLERRTDFCTTNEIVNGYIIGNVPGHIVPNGYQATVTCFPAHRKTPPTYRDEKMTCSGGNWKFVPQCVLEYTFCGTKERGYKAYTEDGVFFVYPEMGSFDVICIGAGGGGYDVTNDTFQSKGKAGDGGSSQFGDKLKARGGEGGRLTAGGAGGQGHYSGGTGGGPNNCTRGGFAGDAWDVGYSRGYFCGSGGLPDECPSNINLSENEIYLAGTGGAIANGVNGGLYGGGAAGNDGGSGGGGGYTRKSNLKGTPGELIRVTVGKGGTPSYGQAAPGLVFVTWGDITINSLAEKYGADVINRCVLDD